MGGCKPSAAIPIPRLPKPRVGLRKPARQQGWHCAEAILSYLELRFYILKNQNFKNMWPFQEIVKMGPCRPGRGRQTFFVKKIYKSVLGQRGAGARRRGGGGAPPQRGKGGVSPPPPPGDRIPPLYKTSTPIPFKFATRSMAEKKMKRGPASASTWCRA